jgi:carboxymethylenebutenolidase
MAEKEIDIETPDGLMNTFITYPDEGGPHPVVLFLMDAMGKRNELHDMARRLAAAGYYVLLPNLYYRTIREYLPDWSDEEKEMEIMFGHTSTITNSMIVGDCRALLEYADRQKSAKSGPVGAVGYSMGGTFAFAGYRSDGKACRRNHGWSVRWIWCFDRSSVEDSWISG